jgi:flagellar hook-associated protein 2
MAGTITMAGLGSGMDVSAMIDALVNAKKSQQSVLKTRATETKAASTAISDVASLLAKLKTSVDALADAKSIQTYAASSSGTAVQATVTGAAGPGRYAVTVSGLARAYRSYSNPSSSATTALAQVGTMSIAGGGSHSGNIALEATDSLSSIAEKINSANLGVQATTFYDGSQFRLQVSGANTGAENAVSITGLDLGLNEAGNLKQQAQSAHIVVDGFDVYGSTNQITGAIPGVTLALTDVTTSPINIETKANPDTLKAKAQAVVDAYNAVIKKVQATAGYGTTKASNSQLAADSTLRSLASKMSSATRSVVNTGTSYSTLNSLGISLTRDGQLTLDSAKFDAAVKASPEAVTKVLAGTASSDGIMDVMSSVVDMFNQTSTGLLTNKRTTLDATAKRLETRATEEQDRLDNYRALLEKQFAAMDTSVSNSNGISAYLTALSSSSTA